MSDTLEAAMPDLAGAESAVADVPEVTEADAAGDGVPTDTGSESAESGQDGAETGEPAERGEAEAQAQEDGRTVPPDIRKHFAELKAQNPALYKKLKGLFFAEREFRTHFPGGPQEALKLKEFVDTVGGQEGWQGVQDSLKSWEDLDALYSNGNPEFVDRIANSDPEAFSQMVLKALERWAELDKDNYEHVMARVVANTLNASPIGEIYRALQANEDTKALAEKLAGWYNGIQDLSSKVPEKKVDPERQKLEREKAEWEEKKQTEFRDNIGKEMRTFYVQNIETNLANEFKARNRNFAQLKKADEETYWAMMNDAYGRVRQVLSADQQFQSKFESLIKEGNGQAAAKLAKSRAERILADVAKKTYKVFNLGTTTQQRKEQAQTNQQRTNVPPQSKLSKAPQPEEIDWNRSDSKMIMDGKAFLKGRKDMVTF